MGISVDIYRDSSDARRYLFLESGKSPEDEVPSEVLDVLGDLVLYKEKRSIEKGTPLIGASPVEIIKSISENGYHIQGTKIEIKESSVSVAGAALGGSILGASFFGGPGAAVIGLIVGGLLARFAKDGADHD
jgi:YcgL domain